MENTQSYPAPTSGASSFAWPTLIVERAFFIPTVENSPSLPALIEQLQNIQLLAADLVDYSLLRSVELLTHEVAAALGRVDPLILDAIKPADYEA